MKQELAREAAAASASSSQSREQTQEEKEEEERLAELERRKKTLGKVGGLISQSQHEFD